MFLAFDLVSLKILIEICRSKEIELRRKEKKNVFRCICMVIKRRRRKSCWTGEDILGANEEEEEEEDERYIFTQNKEKEMKWMSNQQKINNNKRD